MYRKERLTLIERVDHFLSLLQASRAVVKIDWAISSCLSIGE